MSTTYLPHQHSEDTKKTMETLGAVKEFSTVADIFKQLSDTTRIRIFWLLCHCEECVVNISAMMNMSSPAVSHHLRPLKAAGLISCRRDGKEMFYKAADNQQAQLLHKIIEQVMKTACPDYRSEMDEIVHEVHDRLLSDMGRRITIEELSKEFAISATTLKAAFKNVYGDSLAAHINEHRMEEASRLLKETDLSISEICQRVGYESQSKFTATFKTHFGVLPKDYRKNPEGILHKCGGCSERNPKTCSRKCEHKHL